jgi:chromosome segregation ATPase
MMKSGITQEELTAVRIQIRSFGALAKMESILQKALVADEQAPRVEKELEAARAELAGVKAEIKTEREQHAAEMRADEIRHQAELAKQQEEWEAATAGTRKRLSDELSALSAQIEDRRRTSNQLAESIEVLRQQESESRSAVSRLTEIQEEHKAEITALINRLNALAGQA